MTAVRALRHVSGTLAALADNGNFRFALEHAMVHFASGTICTFIPKCACSNLRLSMAMANGCLQSADDWQWIHSNNRTFSPDLRGLATAPFSFVFLRCPFSRLISVFLDKIVSQRPEYWKLHRAEREAFDETTLTFRRFVTILTDPSRFDLDQHWKPQVSFLAYESYDRWYAVEEFDAARAELRARIGLELVDARERMQHGNIGRKPLPGGAFADMPLSELKRHRLEGRVPPYKDMLDDALIATVSELYRQDFLLYQQHLAPQNLLVAPVP